MNFISILILIGSAQGIILFFSIGRLKRGNKEANKFLAIFILLISIVLLGRFFFTYSRMTLLHYKILFFGDFVIFFYGPLLYFYMQKLFNLKPKHRAKVWLHFIPLLVYAVIVLPLMFFDRDQFIKYIQTYTYLFTFMEFFAIVQNLFYLTLNYKIMSRFLVINEQNNSAIPQVKFFKMLLFVCFIGITFWLISFIIRYTGPHILSDYLGYHLVWISLSLLVIGLGYYTLSNPEIFESIEFKKKEESKSDKLENIDVLAESLETTMREEKPYLEPKITLNELSKISGINPHLLSRLINEKFGKNFFEFINYYRVEEFKTIVKEKDSQNKTLLALAFQAGFNSKTTFNTAFKKITKKTPREFLKLSPKF